MKKHSSHCSLIHSPPLIGIHKVLGLEFLDILELVVELDSLLSQLT
jgi:hypothetical protein